MATASVPASSTLRYEKVADHLSLLIDRGALRPGDRLPSVRELARQQHVSVSTVVESYRLLESRGLVEVRPQSGHHVRGRRFPTVLEPQAPRATRRSAAPCKVSVADLVARMYQTRSDPEIVPLGAAQLDPRLLPTERLNRMTARILRDAGAAAVTYPPPAGLAVLRRALARRAVEWGLALTADDFIVTVGGMEALHLCLRAVAKAGDTVVVETPTYYGLLQLMESMGLRVCEVPNLPGTGMDLDQLDAALDAGPVAACLVTPNFNNPTGTLMPDEHKRRLVATLARRGIPLIEDDVYGDLGLDGTRPRPALAFAAPPKGDEGVGVMLVGSASKSIAPGYRVGWCVPGRYREKVERLKYAQTVASPAITQMAIAEFLTSGGYDHHLRQLRRRLAENVQRFTYAVAESFPAGTRISRPAGGFVLWIELPEGGDAVALHQTALAHRILVAPGIIFTARPRLQRTFRLNCGNLWSDLMERSVKTLGRLAAEQLV